MVVAVGVGVGVVSGLLGLGGPMLSVPLLLALGVEVLAALAAAQVQSIVIATVGTIGYALHGSVDWALVLLIGLPVLVGVVVGWRIARALPTATLRTDPGRGPAAARAVPGLAVIRPGPSAVPGRGPGTAAGWVIVLADLSRECRWTTSSVCCPVQRRPPPPRGRLASCSRAGPVALLAVGGVVLAGRLARRPRPGGHRGRHARARPRRRGAPTPTPAGQRPAGPTTTVPPPTAATITVPARCGRRHTVAPTRTVPTPRPTPTTRPVRPTLAVPVGTLVAVPDVVGLRVSGPRPVLQSAGLRVQVIGGVLNPDRDDRRIVAQRPTPGSVVRAGSTVILVTDGT